jgi:pheromone shutdown protein TraB
MEEPAPGTSVETHSSVVRSARRRLALFAGWLRVHALCPGFDERSCDAVGVAALNQAMLEMLPREYARRVATPDEVMSRRLSALRDELGRGEDATVVGYPIVVAIVGAQHVPGIVERLRSR